MEQSDGGPLLVIHPLTIDVKLVYSVERDSFSKTIKYFLDILGNNINLVEGSCLHS